MQRFDFAEHPEYEPRNHKIGGLLVYLMLAALMAWLIVALLRLIF